MPQKEKEARIKRIPNQAYKFLTEDTRGLKKFRSHHIHCIPYFLN
jgi:hypothetical protein